LVLKIAVVMFARLYTPIWSRPFRFDLSLPADI